MNGKVKPRVKSGQPGSYYAALGGNRKQREKDMDSSEYWAERAKDKERK